MGSGTPMPVLSDILPSSKGGTMRPSLCILLVGFMSLSVLAADAKPPTTGPVGFAPYIERVPKTLVKIEMLPIPAGKFVFSPDGKEEPREVEIKRLWMAKTEITWDQYETWYLQLDLP